MFRIPMICTKLPNYLKLYVNKAISHLNWRPVWIFEMQLGNYKLVQVSSSKVTPTFGIQYRADQIFELASKKSLILLTIV